MSPVLNQIQEKVYERPIPYSPILGHYGSNRELLFKNHFFDCFLGCSKFFPALHANDKLTVSSAALRTRSIYRYWIEKHKIF